jgi:hypothetical protein
VIGARPRFGRRVVGAAVLTAVIAGCGPGPATPSPVALPTGSLAPAATAEGPASPGAVASGPSSPGPSGAAIQVDPGLMTYVPTSVDGVPVTFDPETSATNASADPGLARDLVAIAVALAIVPGSSAADDLAVVSVVRLRDPARDDNWFRDWRDTYDQAACAPAGGVVGNAEAQIGGGTVYIGSCAQGVRTYHTRLAAAGIVVSITALGSRRLGEKVMAGLHR